jgi:methyl-accepting chemotaxis protein
MFAKWSLKIKLLVAFLCVGIIPFAVMAVVALTKSDSALHDQAFAQLEAVRGIKKAQIERFFDERRGDMGVLVDTVTALRDGGFDRLLSTNQLKKSNLEDLFATMVAQLKVFKNDPHAQQAMLDLNRAFKEGGNRVDTPAWKAVAARYDARMKAIVHDNGWYDLFLIHADGDVVYTVARESDLGMDIPESSLKASGLGEAFFKAQKGADGDVAVADFSPYAPSNGQWAAFMMAQMRDADGRLLGYAAFQVPIDKINHIAQQREGLGQTGESYLVGETNGQTTYRSERVVKKSKIGDKKTGSFIDKALAGEAGIGVKVGSTGHVELVAYTPLALPGLHWMMSTTIAYQELLSAKKAGEQEDYFAKYIKKYGYYDLFLIHPGGQVFYTVTHEPDYQTNMVNGKYADSGLGRLTRQVLETRQFAVADFAPYAPSNGAPAAFIAQPVVNDGKVELIVALQLSLEAINNVMTQRDGMGETGESYLVGPDKLMRSDSYLDPKHHSVLASFADPQKGGVDTEASREALSGKTDTRIIRDYNGNPVLSAYTPLKIEGLQWALLAEIDEAEAFAAIKALKWVALVVAAIGIAGIVVMALLITRAIVRPVQGVVNNLTELAQGEGDLTSRLAVTTQDEIGKLAERFNEFMEKLHAMIKDITSGVETLSSSSTELSAISQQMSAGAEQTSGKANTVATAAEEMSANMTSVSAAMEQSSTNTGMVAAASEEMTATINEIAKNAENARGISDQAVHQTKDAGKQMADLGRAAQAIGKVTETITEISEQINLLALNATIEAARAGDTGKGFAVVANEIKELAKQTAEATLDIKRQIGGIQDSTGNTVTSIEQIGRVITDVNDIVATIATAVEEQSVSTKEIAENIAQVSNGIGEVNQNVAQSSQVAGDITRDITEVNQAADEMARSSSQVRLSAEELSTLAEQLTEMVGRFKI